MAEETNIVKAPDASAKKDGIVFIQTMPRFQENVQEQNGGRKGWWEDAQGEVRLQTLRNSFMIGLSDIEACYMAGINRQSLYYYIKNVNPAFLEERDQLRLNPIIHARRTIIKDLENPITAWQYLKKKLPEEFGDAVGGMNQNILNLGNINQVISPDYMQLDEGDDLEKLLEDGRTETTGE